MPVVLLGRDVLLTAFLAVLRRRGIVGLPVHFLGKAATFNLLIAFPLLLLGAGTALHGGAAEVARVLGWAFVLWGTALYVWAGLLYAEQAARLIGQDPARAS